MSELFEYPPVARPILEPLAARPLDLAFPRVPISRADAAADVVIVTIVLAAFGLFTAISGLSFFLEDLAPRGGQYLWVLGNGLLTLATIALLLRWRGQGIAAIGLNRSPVGRVLVAAAIAVPACFAAGAISNVTVTFFSGGGMDSLVQDRAEFFEHASDVSLAWVFPISLFVGIYEEMLFRGFLFSRLRAWFSGDTLPVLISAAIFGSLHYPTQGVTGMFQTGMIGLVLGIFVSRARSLWPAIIAHAAIDFLSLAMLILLREPMREFLRTVTSAPASQPG